MLFKLSIELQNKGLLFNLLKPSDHSSRPEHSPSQSILAYLHCITLIGKFVHSFNEVLTAYSVLRITLTGRQEHN